MFPRLCLPLVSLLGGLLNASPALAAAQPNIVVILSDVVKVGAVILMGISHRVPFG